jgi:hypothetical protein
MKKANKVKPLTDGGKNAKGECRGRWVEKYLSKANSPRDGNYSIFPTASQGR